MTPRACCPQWSSSPRLHFGGACRDNFCKDLVCPAPPCPPLPTRSIAGLFFHMDLRSINGLEKSTLHSFTSRSTVLPVTRTYSCVSSDSRHSAFRRLSQTLTPPVRAPESSLPGNSLHEGLPLTRCLSSGRPPAAGVRRAAPVPASSSSRKAPLPAHTAKRSDVFDQLHAILRSLCILQHVVLLATTSRLIFRFLIRHAFLRLCSSSASAMSNAVGSCHRLSCAVTPLPSLLLALTNTP